MRWTPIALTALTALTAAAGCRTPGPNLKTPCPEQICIPPDDTRFSRPIEYPKELLNRPVVKPSGPGGPPTGPRPGMGGMGMGPGM